MPLEIYGSTTPGCIVCIFVFYPGWSPLFCHKNSLSTAGKEGPPDRSHAEFRLYGVLGSSLREELVLYHRLCWLRGSYGVCVAMHYLPGSLFGSKGPRDPQIAGGEILSSAHLRVGLLYPHDAG